MNDTADSYNATSYSLSVFNITTRAMQRATKDGL